MAAGLPRLKEPRIIGWREYVGLPDWGIRHVVAKVDTGARTSALHVDGLIRLPGGQVQFDVVLSRKYPHKRVPVVTELVRVTRVRSSSGHCQERYVVATTMRLGGLRRRVELSLVQREHMLCRMLLGRMALSGFLVDVDCTHEQGKPKRLRPRGESA